MFLLLRAFLDRFCSVVRSLYTLHPMVHILCHNIIIIDVDCTHTHTHGLHEKNEHIDRWVCAVCAYKQSYSVGQWRLLAGNRIAISRHFSFYSTWNWLKLLNRAARSSASREYNVAHMYDAEIWNQFDDKSRIRTFTFWIFDFIYVLEKMHARLFLSHAS